jgi:hypothetical protein
MWNTNFRRFLRCALLFLFLCPAARADLVICVHRQDDLFIASDALLVPNGSEDPLRSRRIFKLEDACCVTITGFVDPVLMDTKTGKPSTIFFPVELEKICDDARVLDEPLQEKIKTTVAHFGERYHDCLQHRAKPKKGAASNTGEIKTRISFLGYDSALKKFFGCSYRFSETNRTVLETVFDSNPTNNAGGLSFVGDTGFARALLSADPKLTPLASDEFRDTVKDLYGGAPVTDGRILKCLLELFQLQKQNAARLGFDQGRIGEPCTIYKITREEIEQMH